MKKLNALLLGVLLALNLSAFAQEETPPDFSDLLQNLDFGDSGAESQPAEQTQQQQSTGSGQTTTQTGTSNSFDFGGIDNFNENQTQSPIQGASPVIFAPSTGNFPVQQTQQSPTFSGAMFQGNLIGSQPTFQAPPRVAQTGPGALAALVPVVGYSLFTFRRKDE